MNNESWVITDLGNVVDLYPGCGFPKNLQGRSSGEIGFYKVSDISRTVNAGLEYARNAAHYITEVEARKLRANVLPAGSVIFARIGEAIKLNRRAILAEPALVDNNVIGAKAKCGINDRYLFHFLRSIRLGELSQATTVPAVRSSDIASIQTPIPPTQEQARIASKIDELFSRIEQGERALERVQKLVERYRQSVLRAAVTGELTRAWRDKHKGKLESGEALLARILKARRDAWEKSELAKMKAKGRKPTNHLWKKKYPEPIAPDTTHLPELPSDWTWASLGQLSVLITSGSRGWKEFYAESGSMFIRAQNIKNDVLELDEIAFVDLTSVTEGLRTKVTKGDLLITITGANVTKSALVKVDLDDAYVSQHVALVRPTIDQIAPFIFDWIISPANGRRELLAAAYGAGKPGLNLEDLKSLAIPLPPIEEQREICEKSMALQNSLIHVAAKELSIGSETLRRAILKAAFAGELTPQDPSEESAFVLLEHIAAERTKPQKHGTPAKGRRKKVKV